MILNLLFISVFLFISSLIFDLSNNIKILLMIIPQIILGIMFIKSYIISREMHKHHKPHRKRKKRDPFS